MTTGSGHLSSDRLSILGRWVSMSQFTGKTEDASSRP